MSSMLARDSESSGWIGWTWGMDVYSWCMGGGVGLKFGSMLRFGAQAECLLVKLNKCQMWGLKMQSYSRWFEGARDCGVLVCNSDGRGKFFLTVDCINEET